MTLKIDYCSDLHVSHNHEQPAWGEVKNQGSTILIIAGDITNNSRNKSWKIIMRAKEFYDYVLFVDGNHEHYDSDVLIGGTEKWFKLRADAHENIHYLSARPVKIDDTWFIGTNGWYDWGVKGYTTHESYVAWSQYSNDSRLIKSPDNMPGRAFSEMQKVRQHIFDVNSNKIVMVTHTAPLHQLLPYNPQYFPELDGSYCNTLMGHLLPQRGIRVWIYGHTHGRNDQVIIGTRFLNNVRGYKGEIREPWTLKQVEV